jgi:ketosteroid isomerase-like protein
MSAELDAMISAWQDAWFAKDASTIDATMTADYVYVGPNGAIMDRAAILQVVTDATYRLTGGAHTERVVVMLGDVAALVRHRWQGTGTFRGRTFVEDHRCVTVRDRSSGQWRIRDEHCSAVTA